MTDLHLRALVDNRGVDVEFAIDAGEVLAVLGPNGAGKTTTLHVIAGLVRPDSGIVRFGDRVLTDTSAGVSCVRLASWSRVAGSPPHARSTAPVSPLVGG